MTLPDRASLPKTAEWRNVDRRTLRDEIIPRDRPAVLKGLVEHWPIVRAGAQSDAALFDYIRQRDQGRPIRILVGQPDIKGVYFYRDDMSGLNFQFSQQSFHATLAKILACKDHPNPPAIYTGATLVSESCPEVARGKHHRDPGPAFQTQDVARQCRHRGDALRQYGRHQLHGRRAQALHVLPAGPVAELYIGPLDLAPGGQPTSLVRVREPDLERYPRFEQAWRPLKPWTYDPGDAIYIPNLWWHNVEGAR